MMVFLKDAGILDLHVLTAEFSHPGPEFQMLRVQRCFFHNPRTLGNRPQRGKPFLIPVAPRPPNRLPRARKEVVWLGFSAIFERDGEDQVYHLCKSVDYLHDLCVHFTHLL